jgi:carbon-monoxide dehydrogenase iron sulfur subunit
MKGSRMSKATSKMIVCRVERCLGCRSCEMACAVAHSQSKDLLKAILEHPKPQKRITVEPVGGHGLPLQCRHCEDAPCIMICPTEAMHRASESGPVLIDQDRCIGCKLCMAVCPFGVISVRSDGKGVIKCDACIERTKAGQEPACVSACPTGALKFVSVEELMKTVRRIAAGRAAESLAKAEQEAEK